MEEQLLKKIAEEVTRLRKAIEQPNLELEIYELEVVNAGQLHRLLGRQTKAEHSKLLGIFAFISGNTVDSLGSTFKISIQNQPVISRDFVDLAVIEKTDYLTIHDVMYPLDVDINTSDIIIEFQDGNTNAVPYFVSFYFLTQKR